MNVDLNSIYENERLGVYSTVATNNQNVGLNHSFILDEPEKALNVQNAGIVK